MARLRQAVMAVTVALLVLRIVATVAASSSNKKLFTFSERALYLESRSYGGVAKLRGSDIGAAAAAVFEPIPRAEYYYHESRRQRQLLQLTGLFSNKPLAVKSDRRDPTNKFRHYRGGFDVTTKHYWASVAFTGVYGYAIGGAWLLAGLALAFLACFRCCCGGREGSGSSREDHSSNFYLVPRLLVLLLSLFAIGFVIGLFVLNHQAFSQTTKVKNTVVKAVTVVTDTIHTVTSTLGRVEDVIEKYRIPGWQALNSTEAKLNEQADLVTAKVDRNVRKFNRLINDVEIAVILILSLSLFLIVAGLVAAFLRWRRVFFVLIVLVWILTACTWLLFGLVFALNNVASDTCQALNEFLAAPANTTLDNFLPCVDSATSSSALANVREGVGAIIDQANSTVITIQRLNNFLRTGNGSVLSLCNPIGGPPDYIYNATCPTGTLPISDLPVVLAPYVCMENMSTFDCLTEGRLVSAENNATLYEFSVGAQNMLDTLPLLSKLADCSFVTDTFTDFVNKRCTPLRTVLRRLWILTMLLSVLLTFLTLVYVVANHRNAHQRRMDSVQQYMGKRGRGI